MFDLLSDLGINSTFNVEDLVPFRNPPLHLLIPFSDQQTPHTQFPQSTHPPPPLAHKKEVIEDILNEQTISMRQGGY